MPSASILTKTSDQVVTSAGSGAATIDITWQTETKYLDAAYDFHDPVSNTERLTIPAAMDGRVYEVFVWVEDAADIWTTTQSLYLGALASGIPGNIGWWGIYDDVGKFSRGWRSGRLVADANEGYFYSPAREFTTAVGTASAAKCRFGILTDNPPILAAAAAYETAYSYLNGLNTITASEEFDVGGVYNPVTGEYTVPEGATLAVVTANGYITSQNNGSNFTWELWVDGAEYAAFNHTDSGRGFGPGTFGLMPVTPGQVLTIRNTNGIGFTRTGSVNTAVEFY